MTMRLTKSYWVIGVTALALSCSANQAPVSSVDTTPESTDSEDDSPKESPREQVKPEDFQALLGSERRLWMSLDGLPCEGPAAAPITVVEYVGYQCPFSRRHETTVQKLLSEYEGKVRFCVRQFVVPADQPQGVLAAYTALEAFRQAGSDSFFTLHRAMLGTDLDEAKIFELARGQGLDMNELRASLKSNRYAETLKKDRADLYALDKSGTPNMFVNGRVVSGAKPYEEVAPFFQDAFEEGSRLVAAGLPAGAIYDFTQKDAIRKVDKEAPRPGEPARVKIRFIHVPTSKHPLASEERTTEEARVIADDIVRRVKKGESFGALAKEFSAASNRARGGEFGTIVRGTLTEDIEDVAFALEVGDLGITCGESTCAVIQRQE